MKELVLKFRRADDIAPGVRVLTVATAVRWIGWGFAESLMPVFLFMFAGTFAEAGLLRAMFDISFIIMLPIAGMMADRMRATTLVLWAFGLYLIVGTGYLMAGLTGLVIFVVIARLANGVSYALDAAGRDTYFMRHSHPDKVATAFGYFDTVANFWWMAAGVVGIWLVSFLPIHWLLFAIVPTSIISFIIVARFRNREPEELFSVAQTKSRYRDLIREVLQWDWKLKMVVAMNFFISFAYAIIAFFVPIELYIEGAGYVPIILVGLISAIPPLFGWVLGRWFDKRGTRAFGYGLMAFGALLALLGFVTGYVWQVAIVFAIGVVTELLSVGSTELVTTYSNPEHFGRVNGLSSSIADIGAMTGPLIAGIMIDSWGSGIAYCAVSVLMFALAAGFMVVSHVSRKRKML